MDDHWPSRDENLKYDIITRSFPIWGLDAMRVGPKHKHRNGTLANLENPWISPVNQPKEEYAQHCPAFVANGALGELRAAGWPGCTLTSHCTQNACSTKARNSSSGRAAPAPPSNMSAWCVASGSWSLGMH